MTPRSRSKAESTDAATAEQPEPATEETTAEETAAEEATAEPEKDSGTEYLNVTAGPITYDRDGRQVGGGDWVGPLNLDAIGQAARRAGHLLPRSAL